MSSLETNSLLTRKAKIAVTIALAICLAGLTFTGCSDQLSSGSELNESGLKESEPNGSALNGPDINAPVTIDYSIMNALTYDVINEETSDEFNYSYIKVSGLKDKTVEKSINDRIKAVYDELRVQDLPPYRGIKTKIPEGSTLQNEWIEADVTGNFNNILSIMFRKHVTYYQNPKKFEKDAANFDGNKFFSEMETLNFDLNTGDEIKLKELFCDNVDHMELINDQMSKYLSKSYADEEGYFVGMYGELKLVESFKGLSEDQIFAISPYGIVFVFDYRTPQFDTSSMAVSPSFYFSDLGDNLAVTQRFYDDKKNLFTSVEPLVKAFVMRNDDRDIGGSDYYQDGDINIYQSWGYPSELPEKIKNKIDQMRELDQAKIRKLKELYNEMSDAEIKERGAGAYEIMVHGDRVGKYINITSYSNLFLADYYEQVLDFHCYDGETLKELKLQDIFIEGYDYKLVVIEAIKKAIKDYDGISEAGLEGKYSDQQAEDILNQISGFNLSTDAVIIPIVHPEKEHQTYGLSVYIPYKDIGCENMNIFQ